MPEALNADKAKEQDVVFMQNLFVDLFYSDETAKKNLLSLYNALHGTDLKDEGLIRKVKIEDILYKNFNNDISCEVDNKVFVFGEHQSTVNPNIPVRYAMYAGRAYEQVLDKRDRYPVEQQLSLSDAFLTTPGSNSMELTVTVININSGKSHEILDKCRILMEYSLFIDTVRKYRHEEDPIKKAIEECIQKGILTEYLMRKGSEVRNMLVAEYSYEEDIRVKQEEARMEGIEQGKVETVHRMLKMGISDFEMIALSAGLSVDEVTAIRDKEYAGS